MTADTASRGKASLLHREGRFRTLIQISDVHLLPRGTLSPDGADTVGNLERALSAIERSEIPIDALLFSGDVTDDGSDASYDLFAELVGPVARRIDAEVLLTPGNHDRREGIMRLQSELSAATATGGADSVLDLGPLRVVGVDTSEPGREDGHLSESQLRWLRTSVDGAGEWGSIVVLHHPPVSIPLGIGVDVALRDSGAIVNTLDGSAARLIVAGHVHFAGVGSVGRIPLWIGGATSFNTVRLAPGMKAVVSAYVSRIDVSASDYFVSSVPVGEDTVLREISRSELRYGADA